MKKAIFGLILGLSFGTITALAISLCNAKDIEYNASDTTWDVDTVEDAVNDLYQDQNKSGNLGNLDDMCDEVAKPNLGTDNKLIPVVIDDDSVVKKVSPDDPDWYNYCNKKWANAVILQNSYKSLQASNSFFAKFSTDHANFECTNCYIDLGNGNREFNDVSIAMRVQIKNLTKTDTKYVLISNKTSTSGFSLYLEDEERKFAFSFYNETTNEVEELISDIIPDTSKYYTIVATYDGHEMNLYVSGERFTKKVEGKIKTSTKNIYIAKNPDDTRDHPYLNVKQAGIFDRVISNDEIQKGFIDDIKLYDGTKIGKYIDFKDREREVGEVIPEGIIESYFVWIPKYKYKLWNVETTTATAKNKAIDIIFDTKDTIEDPGKSCVTPGLSGDTGSCDNGEYMTHPAFTSFGVNGFWVGKFETGYNGADNKTTFSDKSTESNIVNPEKIVVKPSALIWHRINVANAYANSYSYQRELDSHLMKNTEWGAVAYLTNSLYGRCTKSDNGSVNCEEVAVNNYLDVKYGNGKAGYATVNDSSLGTVPESVSCTDNPGACNEYGTDSSITISYRDIASTKASTTGNYSGIYDMSGGTIDYLMAGLEGKNHQLDISNSGFTEETLPKESKYYDLYKIGTSSTDYTRRILGDATSEMGPFELVEYPNLTTNVGNWYNDAGNYINKSEENKTWFMRGGKVNDGLAAGVFYFRSWDGSESGSETYRLVLAPKN